MAALAPKRFQDQALLALDSYLRAARLQGAQAAFTSQTGYGHHAQPFGETPCVCLRIPTGGGKTLLAAHAVGRMAREWSGVHAKPLALWLVPSDAIRTQTLAALSATGHPCPKALAAACGDAVRVCDLEDVAQLCRRRTLTPMPWWWWPRCRASVLKTPTNATSTRSAKGWSHISAACHKRRCRRCAGYRTHWSPLKTWPRRRPGARCWPALWASRAGAWPTGWRCARPMSLSTRPTTPRPSAASRRCSA